MADLTHRRNWHWQDLQDNNNAGQTGHLLNNYIFNIYKATLPWAYVVELSKLPEDCSKTDFTLT